MGKIKKSKGEKRPGPLADQIADSESVKPSYRNKTPRSRKSESDYVESGLSARILKQAREQQQELEDEFSPDGETSNRSTKGGCRPKAKLLHDDNDSDSDISDGKEDAEDQEIFYEDLQVDPDDEAALKRFMNPCAAARRTLADIIAEKITEKQTEMASRFSDIESTKGNMQDLDPRVVEMYRGVGQVLSKYRSGRLPKAFKMLPSMVNWEQLLYITQPDRWTASAMYQGTRIFASNLTEKLAQRYYNMVLLPRVRDDIAEFKKLNFHLYQAMRKALFKPGAFMKGILLPLCEAGNCSLREAIVIGSVVSKNSIPLLHSCAAMMKLTEMPYSGATSIFLRLLFDKNYALPYRVVDSVVLHFVNFRTEKRELPVLWHQSLLTFVQRYKQDISEEQKDALFELLKCQTHHQITPEIRKELENSKCRDVTIAE